MPLFFPYNAKSRFSHNTELSFVFIVQDEDYKYLMFEDHLATVSDTGKELGEFSVTIEPTKHKGQECFLVHANSHGAIDGVPCGTSITAYVGNSLETIEQQHHEYVKVVYLQNLT